MKNIMAVLMSVALVFGLCPGLAYAEGSLLAGEAKGQPAGVVTQAKKGFVADRVYALIGNSYAMMVTEKKGVQTIDIVNSKYQSTLKMKRKYTATKYGYYTSTAQSKFQYRRLLTRGVEVSDRTSNKTGFISFAGKSLVPCAYDSLSDDSSGDYILSDVVNSDETATIAVFSAKTGKKLASANVGEAEYLDSYWSSGHKKIGIYRDTPSGSSLEEVYSFNGKALKRISSKTSSWSDYYYAIAPTIVRHYGAGEAKYYTSAKSSGKLIKSLTGWSYAGALSAGKYVFYSSSSKKVKVVNGKAATL